MTNSTTSGDTPSIPGASIYSAHITDELRRYDEHLRDVRGLAAGTRRDRLRIIGWLLQGNRMNLKPSRADVRDSGRKLRR
jgi:hypothetical protein